MTGLTEEFAAFARARGLNVRVGPAPLKPPPEIPPSIGRTQPPQSPPRADPWIDYTDDFTVWSQGK